MESQMKIAIGGSRLLGPPSVDFFPRFRRRSGLGDLAAQEL